MPSPGTTRSVGAVLVAEGVTADHDRLGPARHEPRHVGDHDRLAEDDAAEDVADRPVRRAVHLLQAELLDPRLVGGDRRALDADAVLLDRVGGVDRDLVVGRVAALDPEVEVLELDVEVGQDQLLLDERPDDPGHLVAVELDDRVLDLDLRHPARDAIYLAQQSRDGDRRTGAIGPMATVRRRATTRSPTSRRRWSTTTSSRPTGRWSRRSSREGADWAEERIAAVGELAGGERAQSWAGSPTRTRRSCAPTTATATASTRSSSTPPGTS